MYILVLYDEFCPLGILLRRFHRIDELRNSIGVGEERLHQLWNFYGIDGTKPQTKLGNIFKEFEGRDVCIERVQVLYLLVPSLVDHFHDKVFVRHVRRFLEGTVNLIGFLFSFGLMDFCSRCVPVNCVIV